MLLRTLLLFLCASSGLCATLGLFQMQKEEDTHPQDAVLDRVVEASDGNIQDTEATTDDISNDPSPHVEGGLPETLMANDIQLKADKEANEDTPVADAAPAEEAVTGSDNKTEDVPIVEAKVPEDPIQDQPLQEEDNEIKSIQTQEIQKKPEESYSRWGFNSIRSSLQSVNGYFDSLVELVGGRNGVCEYRCRYGELPAPRPGYQLPEPNGCSSSLVGFQLDLGIPAMTQCCNQLDTCYDTCGNSKYGCDASFRSCLHDLCSDLKKSLGFGTRVQTCESMADGLFNTVWTLGCRPYMNSQRAACICHEEEKDEL
uniref:Phospholipase A2, group XIIB n=1 Tax=Neogobius melanostomus TaxID=47308 RepID=A0A8C6UZH0_9GOBI